MYKKHYTEEKLKQSTIKKTKKEKKIQMTVN